MKKVNKDTKVPIHPILFGESDDRLMRQIAKESEGHLINAHDGRLTRAFRLLQGGHWPQEIKFCQDWLIKSKNTPLSKIQMY